MALYTIKDTTLTALGDAVRSKTNGPLPIISQTDYKLIDSSKVYKVEMPSYVKRIRLIGTGNYSAKVHSDSNLLGLGVAPGVYDYGFKVRDAEDFTIIFKYDGANVYDDKYFDFEVEIEGNILSLTTDRADGSAWVPSIIYTAIGLDENGNEFKYTPLEMVEIINGLEVIPDEALNITGNCNYRFAENGLNWLINQCGDKITTTQITSANYMFTKCDKLTHIPFEINMKEGTQASVGNIFYNCNALIELPKVNNAKPSDMGYLFYYCYNVSEIQENYFDNWDLSYISSYSYANMANIFNGMWSLRKIPTNVLKKLWNSATSTAYSFYSSAFNGCYCLDEIVGLAVSPAAITSNVFGSTFKTCGRLKDIIFETNEDGTAKTAKWKSQTLDFSSYIGWSDGTSYVIRYNSGITADKQVTDDATYQALKNDPDWFTLDVNYSRYNHDSAVNTINSLPDCSATGTNTIKFKGAAGALTDGGAINTLTEAEIAVAAAQGWTVSLV